jgi:hypothetical protein
MQDEATDAGRQGSSVEKRTARHEGDVSRLWNQLDAVRQVKFLIRD